MLCPPVGRLKSALGGPKKEKTAVLGVSAMSGRVLARFMGGPGRLHRGPGELLRGLRAFPGGSRELLDAS